MGPFFSSFKCLNEWFLSWAVDYKNYVAAGTLSKEMESSWTHPLQFVQVAVVIIDITMTNWIMNLAVNDAINK